MRDAIGGVVNIQMILVFIAIISGYLAFSVSYTKAVHVKDFIINKIEEYEGYDDFDGGVSGKTELIKTAVKDYMDRIGYSGTGNKTVNDTTCANIIENVSGIKGAGSSVNAHLSSEASLASDYIICRYDGASKAVYDNNGQKVTADKDVERYYYVVVTYITIDVPVINQIMSNTNFFQITGKTKLIENLSI